MRLAAAARDGAGLDELDGEARAERRAHALLQRGTIGGRIGRLAADGDALACDRQLPVRRDARDREQELLDIGGEDVRAGDRQPVGAAATDRASSG